MPKQADKTIWIGLILWLGTAVWMRPSLLHMRWAILILLFAVLVLTPLAFQTLHNQYAAPVEQFFWRIISLLQFPAAVAALISCFFPQGILAAVFALPWLVVTVLLAWLGFARWWRKGFFPLAEFCQCAGLMYFSIGGGWFVLAQFGGHPLGFDDAIVLLTAIHCYCFADGNSLLLFC